VQYNKHTKRPTTDDKALDTIAKKEKVFAPLIYALQDYRSLGVFLSTFLLMPTDRDKRFRTSYNPVGTETFRFNSSSDPFGYGGNLQNIPAGGDD
jgi:DNA polymerase I-like protein with 3'-5' exonuclease and polymerase domains